MTRWQVLGLLFAARVSMGFQFQTVGSVGDGLIVAYSLDYAAIGLMIGLFMAPGVVLALPAGLSGAFMSDRWLATFGFVALALGGLVSGMAEAGWVVGAGRLVSGVGFLLTNLYLTKMVADWFEGHEIATAMSLFVMSWPLGIAMGQVGHVWIAELTDWRIPFLIASLYCAVAAGAVGALYRTPEGAPVRQAAQSFQLKGAEWTLILLAGFCWAAYNTGYVLFLSFGPITLTAYGVKPLNAAGIISVASWLMIVSGALCGWIVDRFRQPTLVLGVCMITAVLALAMLAMTPYSLGASLLFGLVGVAPAGVIMAMGTSALPPERRAFGMGVFFTIYFAMLLGGPPITGALVDATDDPTTALTVAAVLLLSVMPAAILFGLVKKRLAAP